jgi:hypothetical protein
MLRGAAFAEANACGTIIGNPCGVKGSRWKEQSMRAHKVRRRIVWLLAAASFGAAAILGASVAAADEDPSQPSSPGWEEIGPVKGGLDKTDSPGWE